MKRSGFTLVELLIAAVLSTLLMAGTLGLVGTGNRMFSRGLQVATGRQAALLFFEHLEDDLAGCMMVPGQGGRPVAISADGRTIAFYRASRAASTLQVTVCTPVDWSLVKPCSANDVHSPLRNGVAVNGVGMTDVHFALVPPDPDKKQPAWLLSVEGKFPEGGLMGRVVTVKRLMELVQPTSIARYGSGEFAADVTPFSFVMLEGNEQVRKLLATAGLTAGAGPLPPSEAPTPSTSGTTAPLITGGTE